MKTYALLAEFKNSAELLRAAEQIRSAGYRKFDCHSPFPIHGMDAAMGLGRSPIGYIVGGMAILGGAVGFALQTWVTTSAYPLVISGKPFFSWQAYIIITFALFVLFGTIGAVFGMMKLNRLPRFHHPLFFSEQFKRVSTDAFMVSITADDTLFHIETTKKFLSEIGGTNIEIVQGD